MVSDEKYTHCNVCGEKFGPDKMHILIDNGRVTRHTYACRRHRYVLVVLGSLGQHSQVQQRTDLEIESLAFAFRAGELKPGWE